MQGLHSDLFPGNDDPVLHFRDLLFVFLDLLGKGGTVFVRCGKIAQLLHLCDQFVIIGNRSKRGRFFAHFASCGANDCFQFLLFRLYFLEGRFIVLFVGQFVQGSFFCRDGCFDRFHASLLKGMDSLQIGSFQGFALLFAVFQPSFQYFAGFVEEAVCFCLSLLFRKVLTRHIGGLPELATLYGIALRISHPVHLQLLADRFVVFLGGERHRGGGTGTRHHRGDKRLLALVEQVLGIRHLADRDT